MPDIKIDMDQAVETATKAAKDSLQQSVSAVANRIVRGFLNDGRSTLSGKEGLGHEIIRKRIEEFILSDAFAVKIDKAIDDAADEQIALAVKALLNSRSRKVLFEAAPLQD